ncbi:MAG TPA: universal stress protein [Candidatus Margulisiibacteriota bacterium]|nr:universal stress protein [Candidatus Margulisiibacteriota bacterium]
MLKTVLVALDESPYSDTATTLALEWGARFGARLLGLGILDKPSITAPEPIPLGASGFKKDRDEARLADAQERVTRFLSKFQKRCAAAGVSAESFEDIGDPTKCILRHAHRCDVIILGYETHFHFETQDAPDTVRAKVLRRSPRPIVVVPRELPAGTGVVVAYGGGREVARTLQTFQLLGLSAGETVHLLIVRRDDDDKAEAANFAAEFLRSHGTQCKVHVVHSPLEPAEVLLEQVQILQPRLVVMGAHAHHPLRDLFFTSVTRAVLQACPVPVLIGA